MSRSVSEWIGATPDTPVPPRVRLRVFDRDKGRCKCGCNVLIRVGDKWETDHKVAIINGGENRESNLFTLLAKHHKQKTADDVAEKSRIYEKRIKHLGIKKKSRSSFQTNRDGPFKKTFYHGTIRRGA